jgi:lipopolysaccharide transport system ATP-binding protein
MSNIVIKVENLSKQYRLGEVGTGTISHDLKRWWHRVRGKEDPFLKIGEENDRAVKGDSKYVWAMRDVSFNVKEGEVLGIIGRNGAGKSTLLKLLSRVTAPTTGLVKARGRIASLLEVGTGFHPDLTGRDNIFLNGAILGMTKAEIKKKFDEIVAFAAVERYIDTPVKRYSSGMYVRLAFAVAAHLESEILIVDEVLAVGDIEFQKKCLGKMKDVSHSQGRTVLFVSHNMGSMLELCDSGIMFSNGKLTMEGSINEVVSSYVSSTSFETYFKSKPVADKSYVDEIIVADTGHQRRNAFTTNESINFNISVSNLKFKPRNLTISIIVHDNFQKPIFASHFNLSEFDKNDISLQAVIPCELLLPGEYYTKVLLHVPFVEFVDNRIDFIKFEIEDNGLTEHSIYKNANIGYINSKTEWHVQ